MSPSDSISRRLAAVASVTAGLVLLGASAGGVVALDSRLAAAAHGVPARLAEDQLPSERDGRCRRQHLIEQRSPEV